MIARLLAAIFGTKNDRELKRLAPLVASINDLEPVIQKLTDEELKHKTVEFRERLANGQTLQDILVEAFAVVREASVRTLGMRHYDVQLIGGMVLHEGKIAEMKTGEGKTLVATLPLYLHALAGNGAHLITVNDYLVRRDAELNAPLYNALGLTVGIMQHNQNDAQRRAAYAADITYGTNNEFGFDYLRDNMKFDVKDFVQRQHAFAIVDEVDSILIDEARTPLIISGPAAKSSQLYAISDSAVKRLKRGVDYEVNEKDRVVNLLESGVDKLEISLNVTNLYAADNILLLHHLTQALRANALFKADVDYVVNAGQVLIVDEFTGRILDGRRYSDGLHQALEAKEGVEIERESQTHATITLQNYFRMYKTLSGMTGTAQTEAAEFHKIYKLGVVAIPTHRPMVRNDEDDAIFLLKTDKFAAITEDIVDCYARKQPVLVGTVSIETSEYLSSLLSANNVPHEVLNAKQHAREAEIVKNAGEPGRVTIATNMAGRGTDIKLGEGVKELGGLRVVGTERHESRRIDNQLRGRSGRQGDPGSSKFYISLEDDFIRLYSGDRMKNLMMRAGMEPGERIEGSMVTSSIAQAQHSLEQQNFDTRKHLLEYDDVMNQQRKIIYQYRREILDSLGGSNELIKDFIGDLVHESIERFAPDSRTVSADEQAAIIEHLLEVAGLKSDAFSGQGFSREAHAFGSELVKVLWSLYERQRGQLSQEMVLAAEKWLLLETIDFAWRTHLNNLEQIKDGINFRGYAQRDPLTEYKKESFMAFERMMLEIKMNIVSALYKMNATQASEEAFERLEETRREELAQLSMSGPTEDGEKPEVVDVGGNRKARRSKAKKGL
jgi:preprotein translocase subunit SecA